MTSEFSIDLISDLNLSEQDMFDWLGKPTSLFCAIAGNISSSPKVIKRVLEHLSELYRGVFYIEGNLEHTNIYEYTLKIQELKTICESVDNVIYLHNHSVILENVAIIGCNGWFGNLDYSSDPLAEELINEYRTDDISYVSNAIKNFQSKSLVSKIIILSHSIPSEYLTFNSKRIKFDGEINPSISLLFDKYHKVDKWLFGSSEIEINVRIDNRVFVNNPYIPNRPYWPKRIEV